MASVSSICLPRLDYIVWHSSDRRWIFGVASVGSICQPVSDFLSANIPPFAFLRSALDLANCVCCCRAATEDSAGAQGPLAAQAPDAAAQGSLAAQGGAAGSYLGKL